MFFHEMIHLIERVSFGSQTVMWVFWKIRSEDCMLSLRMMLGQDCRCAIGIGALNASKVIVAVLYFLYSTSQSKKQNHMNNIVAFEPELKEALATFQVCNSNDKQKIQVRKNPI